MLASGDCSRLALSHAARAVLKKDTEWRQQFGSETVRLAGCVHETRGGYFADQ